MLMSTTESRRAERAPGAALYGAYTLSLAVCIAANCSSASARAAAGCQGGDRSRSQSSGSSPLVIAAVWFWQMLRDDRDEMLQRIVLEGMAMALTVYVPLAALYVNLRTAGAWTPRLDPPDILLAPALLVAVGIAVAARRYR